MIDSLHQTKVKSLTIVAIIATMIILSFIISEVLALRLELDRRYETTIEQLNSGYNNELDRLIGVLSMRIEYNMSSEAIVNAIKNQDHDQLLALTTGKYQALRTENPNLRVMHFHTPDSRSLLRLHNPSLYGDDLSGFRDMVRNANEKKESYFGFEAGKEGLFYRVIKPAFDGDEHIGSLEFGIDVAEFENLFNRIYPNNKYAFVIDEQALDFYEHKHTLTKLEKSYIVSQDQNFFRTSLNKLEENAKFTKISRDGKTYLLAKVRDLYNYRGQIIGVFFVAIDVTKSIRVHKRDWFLKAVFGSILFLSLMLILNLGFNQYIDRLRRYSEEVANANTRLADYFALMDRYIISSETDVEGRITYASQAFCDISGYSPEELIGKRHNLMRHPDTPKKVYDDMWRTILTKDTWEGEIKNRRKNGEIYWVKATITPKFDDHGVFIGFIAIRQDITNRKRVEDISIHDDLTQLYNHRYFNEVMPREILRIEKKSKPLAFMVVDIDNFRNYNNHHGHMEGDKVILAVAQTIELIFSRPSDFAFRLGGESFAITFSDFDEESPALMAERLRSAIEDLFIPHEYQENGKYLTVSIGLTAHVPNPGDKVDDLYHEADKALYKAKEKGKNRVQVYTKEMGGEESV